MFRKIGAGRAFEIAKGFSDLVGERLEIGLIPGSEELLRRALENIIRNAIRYSPLGAEVTIETSTESGSGALIRVADSGPGVPDESLQAIFRPFYRVDSARQTTTGGFGVGLAIAQRTVQIMAERFAPLTGNRADCALRCACRARVKPTLEFIANWLFLKEIRRLRAVTCGSQVAEKPTCR